MFGSLLRELNVLLRYGSRHRAKVAFGLDESKLGRDGGDLKLARLEDEVLWKQDVEISACIVPHSWESDRTLYSREYRTRFSVRVAMIVRSLARFASPVGLPFSTRSECCLLSARRKKSRQHRRRGVEQENVPSFTFAEFQSLIGFIKRCFSSPKAFWRRARR